MRHCGLALLWSTVALGQFGSVAPTGDGSVVYFCTSLRLKGSGLAAGYRVYVFDGRASRLHFGPDGYEIRSVEVSDDGQVEIFGAEVPCPGETPCRSVGRQYSFLKIREEVFRYPGMLQMSRNGRYLLHREYDDVNALWRARWIDLEQGIMRDLPDGASFQNQHAVTNAGRVLLSLPESGLVLWTDGQTQRVDSCSPGWVNPTGTQVVSLCGRLVPVPNRTPILPLFTTVYDAYVLDLNSAAKSKYKDDVGAGGPMSLSEHYWAMANGDLVSLQSLTAQRWRGFATAVSISSDERFVFAVSSGGLVRMEIATQKQDVLIPPMPLLSATSYPAFGVPGAVMQLPVSQVASASQVTLSGRRLEIAVAENGFVFAQVPWDLEPGMHRIEFEMGPEVDFEPPAITIPVYDWQPMAAPLMGWTNYFVRTPRVDRFPFRAARGGELADLYLAGLGRVNAAPAYGEPTPVDPARPVLHAIEATLREQLTRRQVRLEVLSAVLAPGLVGTYVVQVRLPRSQDLSEPFPGQNSIPVVIEIGPAGEKGVGAMGFDLTVR